MFVVQFGAFSTHVRYGIYLREIKERVGFLYKAEGYSIVPKSIGYGLADHDFSETIDDNDIKIFLVLYQKMDVKNIFIIGNAWGWSTFCLATLFPKARINVIDAEIEGANVALGSQLTETIAKRHSLNVHFSRFKSPDHVHLAMEDRQYEIALIDGKHGDMQPARGLCQFGASFDTAMYDGDARCWQI